MVQATPTGGSLHASSSSVVSQAGTEQEEAIFDAVEASIGGVLDLIRDRQIDLISLDQSAAIATEDIQKLHSTVNIR